MGKQKTLRLTWVVLSIVSAFMIGIFFQPGSSSKRRLPPNLNKQQMQQMQQMQRRPAPGAYRAPQRSTQQATPQYKRTPNQPR